MAVPTTEAIFKTLESGGEAWVQSQQESFTRQVQGLLDRLRNIQEMSQLQPALAQVQENLNQGKYLSVRSFVDDLGKQLLKHVDINTVCLRDAMATALVTGCLRLVTARSELELASIARLHDRLLHMRHSAEIVRLADVENKARSKTPEVRANGGWDHPFEAPPADGADDGSGAAPAQSTGASGMDASGEVTGTAPPADTAEMQPAETEAAPDSNAEGTTPSSLKRKPSDEPDSAQRQKQQMGSRDEDERDMPPRESPRKSRGKSTTGSRGKRNSRR